MTAGKKSLREQEKEGVVLLLASGLCVVVVVYARGGCTGFARCVASLC